MNKNEYFLAKRHEICFTKSTRIMDQNTTKEPSVFHSFGGKKSSLSPSVLFISLLVVAAGIVSGYLLVTVSASKASSLSNGTVTKSNIQAGAVYGSDDTATFKDTAEGQVQPGGINGEGQYHLVRPGGDSQNVYMTSSLVDLSLFVGRKVKVWGQTQKAQTAGWLMDVGRVEVE